MIDNYEDYIELDDGEIEVIVHYEYSLPEKETRDYCGSSEELVITEVSHNGKYILSDIPENILEYLHENALEYQHDKMEYDYADAYDAADNYERPVSEVSGY